MYIRKQQDGTYPDFHSIIHFILQQNQENLLQKLIQWAYISTKKNCTKHPVLSMILLGHSINASIFAKIFNCSNRFEVEVARF